MCFFEFIVTYWDHYKEDEIQEAGITEGATFEEAVRNIESYYEDDLVCIDYLTPDEESTVYILKEMSFNLKEQLEKQLED